MENQMKDSGIDWIGNIPSEWELKRLKIILEERKEKNDPVQTEFILSLGANYGVIPYSEKTGGGNKAKDDYSAYKLAYPGDIVMNSMNIISGSVGLSKYFGCVSPVYYMLHPRNEENNVEYYHLLFQTKAFQRSLLGLGNGILMKESNNGNYNTVRMRIPIGKLNSLMLPVPPCEEQKRISTFLDAQCDIIDELISNTNRAIEEYNRLKQSVITQAVTKGIDENVAYTSCNLDWIELIPCTWDYMKLKTYFSFSKGLSITKENLKITGIPVISYGQIHAKFNSGVSVKTDLIRYVDEDYLESSPFALVEKGNFIFADTSEDLAGCGNAVYVDKAMQLFGGYHTIILKSPNENNKYMAYLFLTDAWRSQIRCRVSGIKLYSITQKILKETTIIIPPVDEQKRIVEYLDEKCEGIDKIISEKTKLVEELETLKKSLIYEYVTGKRRVV